MKEPLKVSGSEWEEEREDEDHHYAHQDLEREADLYIIHEGVLTG